MAIDESGCGVGGGLSGVDDCDAARGGSFDERTQQRVVGATEDEGVGAHAGRGGVTGEFAEVDADHGVGDVRIDPAFLSEGYEVWADSSVAAQIVAGADDFVDMARASGIGGDHEDVSGLRGSLCRVASWLDDAENGDRDGFF